MSDLIFKTIPGGYLVHIDPTPDTPGYWINLGNVTQIVQFNDKVFIRFVNETSISFNGKEAKIIIEELHALRHKYGF